VSIEHKTLVVSTPEGYLPSCSCRWRHTRFVDYGQAVELADKHELDAKTLRLNKGSKPSLRSTARMFRENASNPVYSAEEQVMWDALAAEAEEELAHRSKAPLEGQMELF
jgi:hypothetical protein